MNHGSGKYKTATNGITVVVFFDVGGHVRLIGGEKLEFVFKGDFQLNFDGAEITKICFDYTYKYLTLNLILKQDNTDVELKLINGFLYDLENDIKHANSRFEELMMCNMANLQVSGLRTRLEQYLLARKLEKFINEVKRC